MTRGEAETRCAERNSLRPDGDNRHWLAREGDGGEWNVVSVRVPGFAAGRPYKATTEAKPRPSQADDPRPNVLRDVPPYGGAG